MELGPDGAGAEVVVVEELDELDEVVVVVVVVVVVLVGAVVVVGHTSVTPSTFSPGGTSEEIGVPTGTLNTNPPRTVTRNTQPEASTAGDHNPRPATVRPAVASPTSCLRLLSTVVFLLPANACS